MLLGGSGPTLRKHGRLRSSMPVQPQLHVRSLAQDSYAVCSFTCNPLQLLSVACGSSTLATTPIKEVVVGVCGYRRDGDSRSLVLGVPPSGGSAETRNVTCHGGPRMDVRDDLLRRLTMISLIDALRMEHSPLISAGIAIAMAGWVGAGSLCGVRGWGGHRRGVRTNRSGRACRAQHGYDRPGRRVDLPGRCDANAVIRESIKDGGLDVC